MPKDSLNIYFTITDKGSITLSKIGDQTKALDKETQQLVQSYSALQKANEPLTRRQAELERQLISAKKATADASKEFKKLGDEASSDAYDKAKLHQEEIRKEIKLTTVALKENEAVLKQNMETLRKGSIGSLSGGSSDKSLLIGLLSGQVGGMLSTSLGGLAEVFATSALGVPAASFLSSAVSDAISGAAAGAAFGPWGILIGALGGAVSGGISGITEIEQAKDDAFKEYYAELFDTVNADTEELISSGSTIAGSREQTRMAFAKRLGGDEAARDYLDRVEGFAAYTNYDYDEITGYSKLLMNTYASEEVFGVLQRLSDATAGLSLSSSDVETMIKGLNRMRTTGKATSEYLNYFSERGVDVYEALANALGVDKSGIADMITDGDIGGEFATEAILDYIDATYGGLSEDLMSTYDAMVDNLEDIMTSIEAAGGEGYNETRKSGLQAETEAYSGALGEAVSEISRIAGENQAVLENLSEQYTREALSAVLLGDETTLYDDEARNKLADMAAAYQEAAAAYEAGNQEAGLTMERLYEEARALAAAEYESSDLYQQKLDSELSELRSIRENTAGLPATTNDYLLSQEKSKGIASTEDYVSPIERAFSKINWASIAANIWGSSSGLGVTSQDYTYWPWSKKASTETETPTVQLVVTGNNFSGTTEDQADQLMQLIASNLQNAINMTVR